MSEPYPFDFCDFSGDNDVNATLAYKVAACLEGVKTFGPERECRIIGCPNHGPVVPLKKDCKFGARCTRKDCWYSHPPKEDCKFGARCTRKNCWYSHPEKTSLAKIGCKFGLRCTREDCKFSHPPKVSTLEVVCKYGASCRRKVTCIFRHPSGDASTSKDCWRCKGPCEC